MRKAAIIALLVSLLMAGCGNAPSLDKKYTKDHAVIYAPNGEIVKEGDVTEWESRGEYFILYMEDGDVYYTGVDNVVICKPKERWLDDL